MQQSPLVSPTPPVVEGVPQQSLSEQRAKIVCTLGPSSNQPQQIAAMLREGMNVCRLNASHGDHDALRGLVENIRQASRETGILVGILLDLQGPKLRVGRVVDGAVQLHQGQHFVLTGENILGNAERVGSGFPALASALCPDDSVLLDDGLLRLRVERIEGQEIHCIVEVGGVLRNHKGINVPRANLDLPAITEKDRADLALGMRLGIDMVAMSFVRSASDVRAMRQAIQSHGEGHTLLIAKIEKPQALEEIDAIIAEVDGIMIARGDLGVEMLPEQVPMVQKDLIHRCNRLKKPVITATQMLESMITHPRPTRAEASDVANAVLDGTDAVMLSAESASGKYPLEAVRVMRQIIRETERSQTAQSNFAQRGQENKGLDKNRQGENGQVGKTEVNKSIAASACNLATAVDAKAIVTVTLSGVMGRFISGFRPSKAILAMSQHESVLRQLTLYWGIQGVVAWDLQGPLESALLEIEQILLQYGLLQQGDRFVLTAGVPFAERRETNMLRVERIR